MDFETAVGDIEGGKRRVILLGMQIRHVPGSIVLSFIFAEKGLVLNIRFSNTFLSQMKRPVCMRYLRAYLLPFQQNVLS